MTLNTIEKAKAFITGYKELHEMFIKKLTIQSYTLSLSLAQISLYYNCNPLD